MALPLPLILDARSLARMSPQYRDYTSRPLVLDVSFEALLAAERAADNGYIGRYAAFATKILVRDAILHAMYKQRIETVTRKWAVAPGGESDEDRRAYDLVLEAIEAIGHDWPRMLRMCATAEFFGWSACEIDWQLVDGRIWPAGVRPVYHFLWECAVPGNGRVAGAAIDEPLLVLDGLYQRLIAERWVICSPVTELPLPQRGLFRPAMAAAIRKLRALGNWTTYDDRAGVPLVLLNYVGEGESIPPEIEAAYEEIIANMGKEGGAATYRTTATVVQPTQVSDGVGPGAIVKNVNEELTILFLGGALVSASGGNGSYAQASVHADRYYEAVSAHAEDIERTVELQFFRRICDFNGRRSAKTPKLTLRSTPDLAPQLYLEMATMLQALGLSVDEGQLRELSGLLAPINGRGTRIPPLKEPNAPPTA